MANISLLGSHKALLTGIVKRVIAIQIQFDVQRTVNMRRLPRLFSFNCYKNRYVH